MLARCFDPFFTTKDVGKGSGLGLSMVFGFIRQSDGDVVVYGEPRQGTTFRLYLPLLPNPAAAAAPETSQEASAEAAGELVLVVEDDPAMRQVSVDALRGLGYRTIEAGDAATGLAALEAHPDVAVLFSDIIMPGG